MNTQGESTEESLPPDIIIEGGVLVTMAQGQPPIDGARVLIHGDRISNILSTDQPMPPYERSEIIDAGKSIIMPGLVNAHSHMAMTIFRGFADDLPLKQWLFEKIFPAEAKYLNPETVYWGTLLGCLEMIASGTTAVIDGYFFQDETVRAVHRSGLRGLIAQGVIDFPAPGVSDPGDNLEVGKKFIKKWLDYSDLIVPGLFCHSALSCSDTTLKRAREISDEFSLPLQIHLSETAEEVAEIKSKTGENPVQYLDKLGVLNDNLVAVHAVHLDDRELDLLLQKDVKIVHVPESNMKLSSGAARVTDMVRLGLTVGLGTDGCASNNNLDLFGEMDSAAKLAKISTLNPVNLDAATVLSMATVCGGRILGLEHEVGTIEVGKKADIIVLDMESPHLIPLYNPLSTIVYSANGGDVKDVIVNGKVLMKDRAFKTLDPIEIMERVNALSKKIVP
ncbi:amidohydrolase family protein [Thermodesulfobacteriota bacterium]